MLRFSAMLTLALITTSLAAQQATPQPGFENASVRRDEPQLQKVYISPRGDLTLTINGMTLGGILAHAYGVSLDQIDGLPKWNTTTSYTITANPAGDKPLTDAQVKTALQQLLADRLHMVVHRATRQVSGYALTVAKGTPRLEPGKAGLSYSDSFQVRTDGLEVYNTTMDRFCSVGLTIFVHAPVVNETNIPGSFHIKLQFNDSEELSPGGDPDSPLPAIYTALQEQLGLKLVARKVPLETIVIDSVDRDPVGN